MQSSETGISMNYESNRNAQKKIYTLIPQLEYDIVLNGKVKRNERILPELEVHIQVGRE